jgi:RHS repeat-associated protein
MARYADVEDPIALLNRPPDTSGGPSIEDAVKDAGVEVQVVNWVWEQVVGESLVESIIMPITGDFEKIAESAAQWSNVCDALQAMRNNINSGLTEVQPSWTGQAADDFGNLISTKWTLGIEADAQAAKVIGFALNKVAEGSKRACDQALNLIKKLVDRLIEAAITLPIPVVGWARGVKLVYDAIQIYNAVVQLIEGIQAIIEGAQQVVEGIKQVGTALSKIDDIHNLNDAINVGNETAEGVSNVRGGIDSVRGGISDVKDGATTAASSAGDVRRDAAGIRDERAAARDSGNTTSPSGADGPTTANGRRDGTQPGSREGDTTNRPGDPNSTRTPEHARNTCGDPIDVATGEMVLGQTDVELAGILPLVLRRTHISSYRAGRSFGRSWASTLDQRLEFDTAGIVYVADDGMLLTYPTPPLGEQVTPAVGPRWPLARTGSGYTITRAETGQTLHFADGAGTVRPLTAITDRNDNRIDVRRDDGVVTDLRHSAGYHVDATSDGGRITLLRLRTADGNAIPLMRYRYTAAGELAEVINSSGRALKFDYGADGRLTQWTDRNGQWYRYFYDDLGRCVANQGAGGFMNGTFAYDPDRRSTRFTDAVGHSTVFLFDSRNNVVAETDPLGNTTTSEWDDRDRLVSRTDALGRTTGYEYDDNGNATAVVHPGGARTTAEYTEHDLPSVVIDRDGAVWRREYDARGNLVATTDPAGATTRFDVNERGAVTRITDALGGVRRITTDRAGLPLVTVDPLGASTRYGRDEFGRIVAVTDPAGGVSRYGWTIEGQLLSRSRPTGTTERWRYDGEGNQVEHIDSLGQMTRTETTHFDLPAARTLPDGSRTTYTYDGNLRITAIDDAQGISWKYEYDPAGRIVREVDSNGRELRYRYDVCGQVIERVNGAGQVTAFAYNDLGDVIGKQSADVTAEFRYDPMGRMTRAINADADVEFEHDPLGRVVRETVNGQTVASAYDILGRRVGRVTPTGAESVWRYDARNKHAELRTAGRTITFGFDAAGRETERALDTGAVIAQSWDPNHRLTGQTVSAGANRQIIQQRGYRYRADGRLAEISDRLAGGRRFDLDPVGRITGVTGPNWTERYAYDTLGNITSADWPDADEEPQGPREYAGTAISGAGGVRYTRDAQGRVTLRQKKRLSAKPAAWRYEWDSEDRLAAVVTPDGTRWRYRYDALGRRVAKERLAGDGSVAEWVRFTWDGARLAEQTGSAGRATTWEWEPGTFRPLTQVERVASDDQGWFDAQFHSIVSDLVGTPTELLAPDGTVAWQQQTTVWGRAVAELGASVSTPLRFPGQYFDQETGLHYNFARYYDPEIGQYTSTDPLGGAPGPNPYAYAPNPRSGVDPLGLQTCEQKIDNYRDQHKVGKGRNIAVAEYEINGQSGNLVGTSKAHQYPGAVPMPETPRFTADRASDSEWKILEHAAENLDPSATGRIHITSERPVCDSCQGVVDQFRQAFPGITVTYSDLGRQ